MAKAKKRSPQTLQELLDIIQKKHGTRALAVAGDVEELYTVSFLPTGLPAVDEILGGGIPRGHITEFFGPWSGGKTFLALNAIARTQADGGVAAFIDTEVSFSPGFARTLGVDMDRLLISTPEFGEEALDIAISLIKQDVDLVVFDSAASIVSKDDLEKQVNISGFSPEVRLWNAGLKRIKSALALGKPAFVFTNQVRDNIGVMYGPATTEPMGHKSKHESVLRLEVRRKEFIKKGDQKVGHVALARVAKAKYDGARPFAEATFDILYPSDGSGSGGSDASAGGTGGPGVTDSHPSNSL